MSTTAGLVIVAIFLAGAAVGWITRPAAKESLQPVLEKQEIRESLPSRELTQDNLEKLRAIVRHNPTRKGIQRRRFEVLSDEMNSAEIEAALRSVAKETNLEIALWPLLWRWVQLDGAKAFQYAVENKVEVQKVAEAWAELDAQAAKAAVLAVKDWKLRDTALEGVALGVSLTDPAAACELLQQLPGIEVVDSLRTILTGFSKPHHKAAFELVQKMSVDHATWADHYVLADWVAEDRAGIEAWIKTPEGSRYRTQVLQHLEQVGTAKDPSNVSKKLYNEEKAKGTGDLSQSYLVSNQGLDGAVAEWIDRDWDTAIEWLSSLPEVEQQRLLQGNPGFRMAYIRPETAIQMLRKMAPGKGRDGALSQVVGTWTWSDPLAAVSWLRQQSLDIQKASLGSMMSHMGIGEGLQLSASFPSEARQVALQELIETGVSNNYEPIAGWLTKQPDSKEKEVVAGHLVKKWIYAEPEATVSWIKGLSPAAREIAKRKLAEEPGLSQYLAELQ